MNQMVEKMWKTVCSGGEKPRTYGNPERTDHKEGLRSPGKGRRGRRRQYGEDLAGRGGREGSVRARL